MKRPSIYANPAFNKVLRKFKNLYTRICELLKKNEFVKLSTFEQKRLLNRFELLYNRLSKLQVKLGLKIASIALAFAFITSSVNAQEYYLVGHSQTPLFNGNNPIMYKGSRMNPNFTDYDNDGDFDVFIGMSSGQIAFFKNMQVEHPTDSLYFVGYNQNSIDNPLYGADVGAYSAPAFMDIDDDSDMDAFIGSSYNGIRYYKNLLVETAIDSFALQHDSLNPLSGFYEYMMTPRFVDIDNDSDLDVFTGNSNGQIRHYKNMKVESGIDSTYFISQTGINNLLNGVDVGNYSGPAFIDIDDDSDMDCFIGETYGNINFYKNMREESGIDSTYFQNAGSNYFKMPTPPYSYYYRKLDFVDIDNDGDFEAFFGDSEIRFLKNIGTPEDGAFAVLPTYDIGTRSTPEFADLDNDGDKDLIAGQGSVYIGNHSIKYFKNNPSKAVLLDPAGWNVNFEIQGGDNNPFEAHTGFNEPIPAAVDIDHDADIDVFYGNKYGNILFFKNMLTESDSVYFEKITGVDNPFNSINMGYRANMDFIDMDKDGDMDVFIGNGYGWNDIFYFKNMEVEHPSDSIYFVQQPDSLNLLYNFIGPVDPSMEFIDYDDDGDKDVFIGNNVGTINYYKNMEVESGIDSAYFVQQTGTDNPANNVDVGSTSQMAFIDADGDSDYDMITGNYAGQLRFYVCNQYPRANGEMPNLTAVVYRDFEYQISDTLFVNTDINPSDSIRFVAEEINSGVLPSWLSFEAGDPRTFTGTPMSDLVDSTFVMTLDVIDKYGLTISDTFTLDVINEVPTLALTAEDQFVEPGDSLVYHLPEGMFTDEGDTLHYDSYEMYTGEFPSWLHFNDTSLHYYGKSDAVPDTVYVVIRAIDTFDDYNSDTFNIYVIPNNPPTITNNISNKSYRVLAPLNFTFASNTFSDDPWDKLTLTAKRSNGTDLPSWLTFIPEERRFTGTPTTVRTYEIAVRATDVFGAYVTDEFDLEIYNNDPTLENFIPDVSIPLGTVVEYPIPENTFDDDPEDELSLSAELEDGSPLPAWMSFSTSNNTLTGTASELGSWDIRVTAEDNHGATVSDVFNLEVYQTVGIDDVFAEKMSIYPNPSNGLLSIKLEGLTTNELEIEITSLNGQVVYLDKYSVADHFATELDLSRLDKGHYLLSISTKEGKEAIREIVIQ